MNKYVLPTCDMEYIYIWDIYIYTHTNRPRNIYGDHVCRTQIIVNNVVMAPRYSIIVRMSLLFSICGQNQINGRISIVTYTLE